MSKKLLFSSYKLEIMKDKEEIMLNALNHSIRRDILRLIERKGSTSYTQMLNRTELPTGKLNYHLKQLSGLIEKTVADEYTLTPLGKKAISILESIRVNGLDEYFNKVQEVQTRSFSPLMKGLILGGIVVTLFMLGVWVFMGYMSITEGAPVPVIVTLGVCYCLGSGLLIFLINAYRTAPEYIEQFERRIFGKE